MKTLDSTTAQTIRECLIATIDPSRIIVFGSFARGDATEDSDIDIAAITDRASATRANLIQSRVALREALKGSGLAIDFILQSTEQFAAACQLKGSIQDSIATEGVVIYERH